MRILDQEYISGKLFISLVIFGKGNDNTKPTFLIDMKYNTMSENPIERNNSLAGFTLGQSIF